MIQEDSTNVYRQELKGLILKTATELFYQNGVRHVKMDDIANALSISKRTVYEVFSNKAELLFAIVVEREEEEERHLSQFVSEHPDTIDVVIEFYRMNVKELEEINPLFFEDVHKYPGIKNYLKQKHEARSRHTIDFIERAVDEGYFRKDVNYEIFKRICEASSHFFMSAKLYKRYSMEELFRTLLMVLLRGICTEKGVKAIDAHLVHC